MLVVMHNEYDTLEEVDIPSLYKMLGEMRQLYRRKLHAAEDLLLEAMKELPPDAPVRLLIIDFLDTPDEYRLERQ